MIVYGATDQVQHHFWHFMDETHDKYDPEGAKEFRHAIRDTYMHCRPAIGPVARRLRRRHDRDRDVGSRLRADDQRPPAAESGPCETPGC